MEQKRKPVKHSFSFLGDLIETRSSKSIEIIEGFVLKKANSQQLKEIKPLIDKYSSVLSFIGNRFETELTPVDETGRSQVKNLSKKEWNYWVIQHSNLRMDKHLELALALCDFDFNKLFEISYIDEMN